ncbi:membrane protein [Pilimelia terevasa]|uniref:Membrane protein n=2 Tax=Pilimelia terevasa TaxID=53372 RepID=A0A8J3BM98_9ACTN|nr:membrane protein [Pilimelia terevasa]
MGRSHALSGVVVWLAGCAVVERVGPDLGWRSLAVGALVAGGAALAPDLDHPGSTAARVLGPVTRWAARGVDAVAVRVRDRTCACCARRGGGHRTLTHTALFAVALGALAALAGWAGPFGAAAVVYLSAALAMHGLLRRRTRGPFGGHAVGLLAAAATVGAAPGGSWWWLGLPVFVGCLTHTLGDSLTVYGTPLLWPLRVRGCRWALLGTPRRLRFRTGGTGERVAVAVIGAAGVLAAWALAA